MYYLKGLDDFVGLENLGAVHPKVRLSKSPLFAEQSQMHTPIIYNLNPNTRKSDWMRVPKMRGLGDFGSLGSTAACKAGDCDCMYGKIVKAITFYNAPDKSTKEYSSYRKTFESYQAKYEKCMKALGKVPIKTDINTPPPGSGITIGQPAGAGAAAAASGGLTAQSLLDPTVQALLQQQGISAGAGASSLTASGGMSSTMKMVLAVGGAVVLGSMILMLTGKKKSPMAALTSAVASPAAASAIPGVLPVTVKIRRRYTSARRSSRRSYRRRR